MTVLFSFYFFTSDLSFTVTANQHINQHLKWLRQFSLAMLS